MHRSRLAALLAVALVLFLAGCGGDDGGDSAKEKGDESTVPEVTEPPDPAEEPETVAESMNLDDGEFMDTWTEEPAAEDDGEDPLDACFTSVEVADVEEASVDGAAFTRDDGGDTGVQTISSSTIVVKDVESAEAMVDDVSDEAFAECAQEALVAEMEADDVVVQEATLTVSEDPPDIADQAGQVSGSITIEGAEGAPVEGQIGLTFVRSKTVITAALVLDLGGTEFDALLFDSANAVAEKHLNLPQDK